MAWFMLQGFCWIDACQMGGNTTGQETVKHFTRCNTIVEVKQKNNSLTNSGKNEVQKNTSYHWARP